MELNSLYPVIALGFTALFFAVVIFFVDYKFKVEENPLIEEVTAILPGANCGACGFPGCKGFAEALVNKTNNNKMCPVANKETVEQIGKLLGAELSAGNKTVALVRCNGHKDNSKTYIEYQGISSCAFLNTVTTGLNDCRFSCLRQGDCVEVCQFNAIKLDPITSIPVVDNHLCTGCGMCASTCPRNIISMITPADIDNIVYVSCSSKDRGNIAKAACNVACIGCGKCVKTCKFDAITLADNLATINNEKCTMCYDCVNVCPTGAILIKKEGQINVNIA